ncbi:hypothetical protein ISN76_19210 [Dyella halodurans]|uniref:Lipoprotein n=1 Tax=Dyella halodurans TaxID=1920171 RepID=A0ABV9C1F0_9GAMM|nr:hypothetical protein [Dyella halodurans]
MAYRVALAVIALFGAALTCGASAAEKPSTVTLDGPDLVPKRQTITKDTTCTDDAHCVDKRALTLECRNGVSVQASITQPRQARATLTSLTYRGKPLREETLHTVNLLLSDRPSTAVVEVEGYCGPYEAAVYIDTYADAYLKTRRQEGATIMVSLTTDGQESVQVGPSL